MAFYTTIQSARSTNPDFASLLNNLRNQIDTTIGIQFTTETFTYILKKNNTDWTPAQITQAIGIINSAPQATSELAAQSAIDNMDIPTKALLLTLLDQINLIRSKLPTPLVAITPAQAIQAVRDKAGTL